MKIKERKYLIVSRRKKNGKSLEGIRRTNSGGEKGDRIFIHNWVNWEHSFWVKIRRHGRYVIVDSGLIEELAREIKEIKRKR